MENLDKVHSDKLYFPDDEGTLATQRRAQELMYDFNATRPGEVEKWLSLLHRMLAECGQGCWIEPPMKANWGGANLHLGEHVYINAGLSLVDDTHIFIGDYTMLGPNVMIATAGHPILPSLRREECMQYNLPVHIGSTCWIGASVSILPGVSIGDGSVIGAGAVVTKDIPSGVVAVGNPCRVIRQICDHDRQYYAKGRRIDWKELEDEIARHKA